MEELGDATGQRYFILLGLYQPKMLKEESLLLLLQNSPQIPLIVQRKFQRILP
jgi:hypothetical protein